MHFAILGPVEVELDGRAMPTPRAQQRGVLGYLLTHANTSISVLELIDAVWGGAPPATARAQIYTMIANLRRQFRDMGEPERLQAGQSGYQITVGPGELDADVFDGLRVDAARAERERDLATAEKLLILALDLWRGSALKDATGAYVDLWQAQLDEKRLLAQESLAHVWLAMGKHGELAAEIPGLLARYPYRESLFRPYMLALYRCAREPEALQVGRELAGRLAEEFGIDPTEQTSELISAMLRHDPALDWQPFRGAATIEATVGQGPAPTDPVAGPLRDLPYRPLFVGRHHELAELDAAWTHARERRRGAMVLLHGPAGSGKSALATEWAYRHRGEFPDGTLYVDAGSRERTDDPRLTDPEADFLLVIDGERSSAAVRSRLPSSVRATVVVTSTRRLDGLVLHEAAHPVFVGPMEAEDAVALIEATVVHAGRFADRASTFALAERCDHWPLALRIAAARMSCEPGLTVAGLVDEMADPAAALDSLRLRGDRYSLNDALESTVELLSVEAREAINQIGSGSKPNRDREHGLDGLEHRAEELVRVLPELLSSGLARFREGGLTVLPLFAEHLRRRSGTPCVDGA
ncbi:BTAD domain-containing putative transcriptional regulator [Nocardioides astragali]|uniref:BTAD domain-containing putative transcriptional regulator n=1 Tax=Nocardioides astragali TaxID=1776736 RepID=A0ABW2MUP5_9ACTN|nr:BTAD domain-containing putative transcriptional regulator [Nocardioides astragali]